MKASLSYMRPVLKQASKTYCYTTSGGIFVYDFSKHGINYQFIDNFRVSQHGASNRTEDKVV